MKNEKLLFCNLKEINISPNSSYNFDEMYNNNDILTYSESKSESMLFLNKNKNNDYLMDNKNQSLNNIVLSQEGKSNENNDILNNKINYEIELSELQISLSNLLSDKDNKEIIIYNNVNKIKNPNTLINDKNYFIDISSNASNNKESNNENNKLKNNRNDEQSSVCNYSKSSYLHDNNDNTENKKYNIKIFSTSPKKIKEFQIVKGEDINISLSKKEVDKNIKVKNLFNKYYNYKNINLTINKAYNFSINSTKDYSCNTNFNLTRDNFNSFKNNTNSRKNKNKIKLINNKNILKVEPKKFFYQPKIKINKNIIKKYKDKNIKKPIKAKINITELNIITNPRLIININNKNQNNTDNNLESGFMKQNKVCKISNKFKNNTSIITNRKNNSVIKKKKLYYLNKNKNKEKYKTINIYEKETFNNNKNITFNNKIFTKDLIKKFSTEQKKTNNKLIKNFENKNKQNENIINFIPLFNKVFEKKLNIKKNEKEKNKLNTKSITEDIDKIKIENKNFINTDKKIEKNNINLYKKINSPINLISLLNYFNKEKNEKKNKSLFNFGNLFFINQNQSQIHKKAETEINIKNDIKKIQKPKIITDFSNYKKIKQNKPYFIDLSKRFNTEVDSNSVKNRFKNDLN